MLNPEKIQSHINTMKAMAKTMLNEAAKVELMLEVSQSKRSLERDAETADTLLNYNRRFEKRLQKGKK